MAEGPDQEFSRLSELQLRIRGPRLKAHPGMTVLGNDVRRDLVFDEGDAVAQLQLAFLQPLQPQQIRCGRLMQGIDRRVEIAVFLLQPREFGFEFALIFVGHGAS
jgi:hypothetical protein